MITLLIITLTMQILFVAVIGILEFYVYDIVVNN